MSRAKGASGGGVFHLPGQGVFAETLLAVRPQVRERVHWRGKGWLYREAAGRWQQGENADNDARHLLRREIEAHGEHMRVTQGKGQPFALNDEVKLTGAGWTDGVLKLVSEAPGMHSEEREWDTEDELLCTPNGVVDLRTGKLHAHKAADRLSRCTAVAYRPKATCPVFLGVVDSAFEGEDKERAFFEDAMGNTMFGGNPTQKVDWLRGVSGSGKSTILIGVIDALGDDHAYMTDAKVLVHPPRGERGGDVDARAVARLMDRLSLCRLVVMDEVPPRGTLNSRLFKQLGDGSLAHGQRMYGHPSMVRLKATAWVLSNSLPVSWDGDDGEAVKRRFGLMQTGGNVPEDVKGLVRALELEGVLAWLVKLAVEAWKRRQVTPVIRVPMADASAFEVDKFTGLGMPVEIWFRETLEFDPGRKLTQGEARGLHIRDLLESFRQWEREQQHKAEGGSWGGAAGLDDKNFRAQLRDVVGKLGGRADQDLSVGGKKAAGYPGCFFRPKTTPRPTPRLNVVEGGVKGGATPRLDLQGETKG